MLQPTLFDCDDGPPGELAVRRVSHRTATLPCEQWHYAGRMPSVSQHIYGIWEQARFEGVIVFGATVARLAHNTFHLTEDTVLELTRIAMRGHAVPLTRIISQAINLLKCDAPSIKLLLSYADPAVGHIGTIYQAASWTYLGLSARDVEYTINGKSIHSRTVFHHYGTRSIGWVKKHVDPDATTTELPPKHKYAFGLDKHTRRQLQGMALPYPKLGI